MQVPAPVALNSMPETVHPVAVPSVAANETAPLPEPPPAVSVSGVPAVPPIEVTFSSAWVALAKVTVVGPEEIGTKVESPALVAVTAHVPAEVVLRGEPETAQPLAVPSVVVKVVAPVPLPPLVVSGSEVP